ncbi:MAG: hypothetical protein PHV37_02045 [Candidatus Gastranaerophilales bacterium]|nr:hypothetical protein [Candidatus Gastranaerophilales bacterium]
MIKVLYDENGKIKEFWDIPQNPATPFIEIDEETHKKIANKSNYKIIDKKLVDISNTEEYISRQNAIRKANQTAKTLNEIYQIEQKQARTIREIILNNNEDAIKRLKSYNEEIEKLRVKI